MPRNPAFYFHSAAFLLQGKHKFSQFLCRFCKISLSPSSSVCALNAGTKGWFCPAVEGGLPEEASSGREVGRAQEARWRHLSAHRCNKSGSWDGEAFCITRPFPAFSAMVLQGRVPAPATAASPGNPSGLQILRPHPRPAEPETLGAGSRDPFEQILQVISRPAGVGESLLKPWDSKSHPTVASGSPLEMLNRKLSPRPAESRPSFPQASQAILPTLKV